MSELTLVIGNKNYSSWSLRPWLAMRMVNIPFREVRIPLYDPATADELASWSPSGQVPLLQDDDLKIWDSLAICEYLAEHFPDRHLWPEEERARAVARSVSAEMHAGFANLRRDMSMNIRRRYPDQGRTPDCLRDIQRILQIWGDCRSRFGSGGNFLFGRFSIADAMFAPVVLRFQTYAYKLDGVAQDYAAVILALAAMREWENAAVAEFESIPKFDK
ncbi:MAG: glutathione S-transferase family protein [Burkholderiales bacterium]